MLKVKIREWLKRYLPAEIIGIVAAVSAASITHLFTQNLVFIAYSGSIGESVGFYLTIFIQNIVIFNKRNRFENKSFSFSSILKITTTIILEFGPAGIIDGLVLRPFLMYTFSEISKNLALGILIGKLVSDFAFYLLVILSYEMKKHRETLNANEPKK